MSETIQNGSFESGFDFWTNGPGGKHLFGIDDEMAKATSWEEDMIEGAIVAWIGGYFTNGANAGYTRVLGSNNTIAAVNALLNAKGFYVCDGAALNLGTSTIFNGAGRYLPNLTDDRFIMGCSAVGGIGGSSTMAHTHGIGSYAAANESAHTHAKGTIATGNESAHTHGIGTIVTGSESTHTHGKGSYATASDGAHAHSTSGRTTGAGGDHSHTKGTLAGSQPKHTHSVSGSSENEGLGHTHSIGGTSHHHNYTPGTQSQSQTGYEDGCNPNTGGWSISNVHKHSISFTSGSDGNEAVSISGSTGSESAHTHSYNRADQSAGAHTHALSGTSAAGSAHNHSVSGSTATGSAHNHSVSGSTAAGSAHNHSLSGTSAVASNTENRPRFLSVFYLIYVFA